MSAKVSVSDATLTSDEKSKEPVLLANFIANTFVAPNKGQYLPNKNPATDQIIAQIPRSDSSDVDAAVAAAKKAFSEWRRTTIEERARYLRAIADGIEKRFDEFVETESRDNGKPMRLCSKVDIPRACANFRFYASKLEQDSTGCHSRQSALHYTYRMPLGVCALISPWNLPIYLLSWKIAPAIANGNTVVCKPSELTPLTASLLGEVIIESGLPSGVVNIIHGIGIEAGSPLCVHPDIAAISFTGGTVTGAKILRMSAPLMKKLSCELGGKNATVIFEDCEMDAAVAGACRAAFANQGQICLCGSRIFVEQSIAEDFIKALVFTTQSSFTDGIGDPSKSRMGSLISLDHRDKVESYVKLAIEEGGTVELGGKRPDGLEPPFDKGAFYEPTIISGLSYQSRCATEEIFGPVVTVHTFETETEVIEMCNATKYGLAGSVWTKDIKKGHRVAQAIESGMIWVNCWLVRDLRCPFGGVKHSGVGREGGDYAMDFWTHQKNITIAL